MSYRELRDASEILRAMGFPRLVSMENFRFPNFALMAEILEWTVKKFEPNIRLPKNIGAEADRVIFVKTAVLALVQKAHVKLNPKNLYQSDGYAIRELLPVLRMLYINLKRVRGSDDQGGNDQEQLQISTLRSQLNAKRQEVREAVQLAAQLPQTGANLFDLLTSEVSSRELRVKALSRSLNTAQVEAELRERIAQTQQKSADFAYKLAHLEQDEQDMQRKIDRRRRELEQLQKRLAKLQSFRPPYMDEYERFEQQLRQLYTVYVVLFRNYNYVQQQLWQMERVEKERSAGAEQSMRMAVERMRVENETAAPVIAGIQLGTSLEDQKLASISSKEVRVFGTMTGTGLDDDDDDTEGEEGEDYGDGDIDDDGILETNNDLTSGTTPTHAYNNISTEENDRKELMSLEKGTEVDEHLEEHSDDDF